MVESPGGVIQPTDSKQVHLRLNGRQWIALLVLMVFVGYLVVLSSGPSRPLRDVEADWMVAQAIRHGLDPSQDLGILAHALGESINTPGTSELDDGPWINPRTPGAWVVLYPLGLVGIDTSTLLFLALSGAALVWLALVAVPRLSGFSVEVALLWTVLLLASAPIFSAFEFGTQSILICALVAAVWLTAREKDGWAGGVALAVVGVLKLWPLFLLVPLAAKRRWTVVASTAATAMLADSDWACADRHNCRDRMGGSPKRCRPLDWLLAQRIARGHRISNGT